MAASGRVGSGAASPVSQSICVFGGDVRLGGLASFIMVSSMLGCGGMGFVGVVVGVVSIVSIVATSRWYWGSKNLICALSFLRMKMFPYRACQAPGVESKGIGERFSESIQYQMLWYFFRQPACL